MLTSSDNGELLELSLLKGFSMLKNHPRIRQCLKSLASQASAAIGALGKGKGKRDRYVPASAQVELRIGGMEACVLSLPAPVF